MLTFQQIIATLNTFWETRGCVIQLGHDLETGAGTFNPVTFLGCLGRKPCFAAYVEPSRRPTDGRYGENPNRVQRFHQYQVIMKPSPPDIQQSYLQSLEAIGLNLKEHDIRFVHDDWESPTLGAHGLGWEVWVDGMEVTQFTYFQGVANLQLSPITVELTYGLERLAMYLQNVDNIFDVKWNEKFTLRDLMHRSEVEWSDYNFTTASTKMWHDHFEDYEQEAKALAASTKMWHDHFEDYAQEAKALVARGLALPAYDFVIKASHAFNMLEARGVISVTERTGYIARIRELARKVAGAYLEKEKSSPPKPKASKELPALPTSFSAETKKDFLFEIGSEQLPATFVPIGMRGLKRHLEKILTESGLSYDSIDLYGTPRRLSAIIRNLAEATAKVTTERKGPGIDSAFDESGNPSKQGAGFLHSLGYQEATLDGVRSGKFPNLSVKDNYLYAQVTKGGESVYEILSDALPKLILTIEFPKRMRWADLDVDYARPIHWIVALYGNRVIPFAYADVTSSNFTYGHAQRKPEKIIIARANDYVEKLREGQVLVDVQERRELIESQVKTIEAELGAATLETERVLKEVVHLTEWPEVAHATFDKRFLKVPAEVLISEMVEHQRYFPLAGPNGKLINAFLITADNKVNDLIIRGNQKVLSARLSDGVFLYEEDLKGGFDKFNQKLEKMTFQKDLGSMTDKVLRIMTNAEKLNSLLKLADPKLVERAARFCKADLASQLVGEFPELQGTIGKYYALAAGEKEEVALAIEEHWLPISDKGQLPESPIGIVLSLADKLDNLLSYYKVGLKPTSSSDPYALRRQTIGILKILIENNLSLDLFTLLRSCDPESPIDEIMQFITSRAKGVFEELGYSKDAIEASLAGMIHDPCDQLAKVKALDTFRKNDSFEKLFEVFKRAKGQIGKQAILPFDPALAHEPAEKKLVATLDALSSNWESLLNAHDYEGAFNALATLQQPLAELFDNVKILAEDEKLKNNRIALLQKVFALFEALLDFNRIQGA